jgi:phenylalanyl-tRNA synthetase alpha chain
MKNLGFSFSETGQMETEENNFDKLNIDKFHPTRRGHDTFFLNTKKILRTQTTNNEIYCLENFKTPVAMYTIGAVFRNDNDATHMPMFHQMEGFYSYKDANVSTMISTIKNILKDFFENDNIEFRFRSSYFPFTELSVEVDMKFNDITCGEENKNQWLEIMGAGILHPNVLKNCKYNDITVFAFGMGVERLAMLKYGIKDIRSFYSTHPNVKKNTNVFFGNF